MFDRAVLTLSQQGRAGQDDRQHRDLIDDGHDAVEPGCVAVGIEFLASYEFYRERRSARVGSL